MLSRKHYRVIASIVKDNSVEVEDNTIDDGVCKQYINKDSFINDLTMYFKSDNKLFSWERFVDACD